MRDFGKITKSMASEGLLTQKAMFTKDSGSMGSRMVKENASTQTDLHIKASGEIISLMASVMRSMKTAHLSEEISRMALSKETGDLCGKTVLHMSAN
jgi:hypothetical protein